MPSLMKVGFVNERRKMETCNGIYGNYLDELYDCETYKRALNK